MATIIQSKMYTASSNIRSSFNNIAYVSSAYSKHSPKEKIRVGTYTNNYLALVGERISATTIRVRSASI